MYPAEYFIIFELLMITGTNNKTCAVIGAGVSGLAAAIRMRSKGYAVTVYEANSFAGGKLSSESCKGYRFDMGPSVFTMPQYVDELFILSGKDPRDYFNYKPLDPVYHYFFEDGTQMSSRHGKAAYAAEMAEKVKDSKEAIAKYLDNTEYVYHLTADVFLHNSLYRLRNLFTKNVVRGLFSFGRIGAFETMNEANEKAFRDPKMVQIFNRYATYNGSSPYLAPATLNVIPHLEIIEGAYYPAGGMYAITEALLQLGKDIGIAYKFSCPVQQIIVENKKVKGVMTGTGVENYDVVISNMDIYNSYQKLMPDVKRPEKTLRQPKSSSAVIFYWGIKKEFKELGLHNILFSSNYPEEFDFIFGKKMICRDPTIYINITSKHTAADAPPGCENWFTMINAPNNSGQDWDALVAETRKNMIAKINRVLNTDIEKYIDCEMILDPRVVESRTSSAFGAIYGNASNNKFAAFLRHANFSKEIRNLYFCGGSVHPGPSIPLCLLSAKITTGLIK